MKFIKNNKQALISSAVLACGVFAAFLIFANGAAAQTAASSSGAAAVSRGITFPIAELGNCSSESDCRNYCDDPSHLDACLAFAKSHGLISAGESRQAEKFASLLRSGQTPGDCQSEEKCQSFCSDTDHLDACLAFAKKLGIDDEHIAQGEKIAAYLRAGGKLPGGCASEESCRAYCGDFSHAEECYNFAKSAGIAQVRGLNGEKINIEELPPPAQMQKILELMKNGETPGGCKTKDDCEAYCKDSSHLDVCLDFAVKAGFMTQTQADMVKKTGGKGPDGCDSEESCQTYCNEKDHQEECFAFAKDHGLLSQDNENEIRNGLAELRAGLSQAPPQVVSCLQSALGPNIVDDIKSGKLLPGPDLADGIRNCFEKFGQREENATEIFGHLPENIQSCIKQKLGGAFAKIESGEELPGPDLGETVKSCFESESRRGGGFAPSSSVPGGENENGGENQASPGGLQSFLNTAPAAIIACLKQELGDEFAKLQAGTEQPPSDFFGKVSLCYEEAGKGLQPPTSSFPESAPPSPQ